MNFIEQDPTAIGERIRNARKNAGLRQQQLADLIGVVRTTLVAMEQGKRRVQPHELNQIAIALGMEADDFLQGVPLAAPEVRQKLTPEQRDVMRSLLAGEHLKAIRQITRLMEREQ